MNGGQRSLAIEALDSHEEFLAEDYRTRADRLNSSLGGLAVESSPEEAITNRKLIADFIDELPRVCAASWDVINVSSPADIRSVQANTRWAEKEMPAFVGTDHFVTPHYILGSHTKKTRVSLLVSTPSVELNSEADEENDVSNYDGFNDLSFIDISRAVYKFIKIKSKKILNEHLSEREMSRAANIESGIYTIGDPFSHRFRLCERRLVNREGPTFSIYREPVNAISDYTMSIYGVHDRLRELALLFGKTAELRQAYEKSS